MPMESKSHWQKVYETTGPTAVSWYQPVPARSLELIRATGLGPDAPILDVGGGASTLVDHLVDAGFTDLTVLDIAPAALRAAQGRLGPRATQARWIESDVLDLRTERRYALWHDRAVLHFLTSPVDQDRYLSTLRAVLQPAGHVIIATFSPDGPTRCSGLPVLRHSAESLGALLGPGFALRRSLLDRHSTPGGQVQQFLYGWWQAEG